MSYVYQGFAYPPLFHWSPPAARKGIVRRGLRATCPTAVPYVLPEEPMKPGHHWIDQDELPSVNCVCLGTSPMHAWALSGDISGVRGETWDLWEVRLDEQDRVYPHPEVGMSLGEVRVGNAIPKSRVLWVAERTVSGTYTNPVSRRQLGSTGRGSLAL